jgi:mannose-6-phosphate isomerase-like protein (cupin superfamily)
MSASGLKPIRRVVTGNDPSGRSRVVWDSAAPNAHPGPISGRGHTDLWAWRESPAPLSLDQDDGNLPYDFPGPPNGGHLRIIHAPARPTGYDPVNDPQTIAVHEPREHPLGRRWDRGGADAYSGSMHKTETVDYAILLEGERNLVLDDGEVTWRPGDIVVQVGAWHQWLGSSQGGLIAFDMIAARFVDGPAGTGQGHGPVMRGDRSRALPGGVKAARRIVTIDREPGRSVLVSDGPSPDVRTDPARPGFALSRLWVTDGTPAKIVFETLQLPHTLEPPPGGSILNVVTFPPDDVWKGKVGATEVEAFFRSIGAPRASTYSARAPHPYMQRTRSLDFCVVLEGEIVLVLDTQEVQLKAGEFVIQRGANHAWSNRSNRACVVAMALHDGAY